MNNALYYDRLCWQRERELKDPNDILLDAKLREQEIAEERKRQEEQADEADEGSEQLNW